MMFKSLITIKHMLEAAKWFHLIEWQLIQGVSY